MFAWSHSLGFPKSSHRHGWGFRELEAKSVPNIASYCVWGPPGRGPRGAGSPGVHPATRVPGSREDPGPEHEGDTVSRRSEQRWPRRLAQDLCSPVTDSKHLHCPPASLGTRPPPLRARYPQRPVGRGRSSLRDGRLQPTGFAAQSTRLRRLASRCCFSIAKN